MHLVFATSKNLCLLIYCLILSDEGYSVWPSEAPSGLPVGKWALWWQIFSTNTKVIIQKVKELFSQCSDSCTKLISGSVGENLTDGDTNTCSPVRNKNKKYHYQLGIHDNCVKPEVNVAVTVDNSTTCYDVRGAILTEKPNSKCDDVTNVFHTCNVIADNQYHEGKRFCSLRCKCAASLNQCLIHIFPGIAAKDMSICEIVIVNIFWTIFIILLWPDLSLPLE